MFRFRNGYNGSIAMFHSSEHCSVSWWSGPGSKLILPESNNSNWEKAFKFLYSDFEIKNYLDNQI